jgi:8-oxo-dGTP diphosphatase
VIRGIKIIGITNDIFTEASKHYITLFAKCEREDPQQQPQVRVAHNPRFPHNTQLTSISRQRLEPNKCEGWSWKSWEEIRAMANKESGPSELFLPVVNLVRDNPNIDDLVSST